MYVCSMFVLLSLHLFMYGCNSRRKRHNRDFTNKYLEELAQLANTLELKEYWEFSVEEVCLLIVYLLFLFLVVWFWYSLYSHICHDPLLSLHWTDGNCQDTWQWQYFVVEWKETCENDMNSVCGIEQILLGTLFLCMSTPSIKFAIGYYTIYRRFHCCTFLRSRGWSKHIFLIMTIDACTFP